MKVSNKVVRVPLSSLEIIRTENVREDEAYDVIALQNDIALRGQQDPAVVEKIGDKFHPIKGFRRATALMALAGAGIIDPTTQKRDDRGELIPNTGKPFEHIDAIVYENLNDRERLELLLDHGQRRGLNKVELLRAFERSFEAAYTEKDIAVILYGLLEQLYPPNKSIENTAEAKLNYYRGVIQTHKHVWRAPRVLHDAWVDRLKGLHAWPVKSEMVEMSTLFQKECESNIAYNRNNPGPKFQARWAEFLKKQAEAAKEGKTRSKTDSMANRTQVEDMGKACDSLIIKIVAKIVLRDIPQDKLAVLDRILVDRIEKEMSEETRQMLLAVAEVATVAPDEVDKTE